MRIAQIAPIAERVPPKKYGGTERVIYALTEELVKRGHEVTLFATGDSQTSAKLVSVFPTSLREAKTKDLYGMNTYSSMNNGLAYAMQKEFDVIHDHNPHLGLAAANIATTPVVMTWHGPYNQEMQEYFRLLNRVNLVSISKSQALRANLPFAGNVYNGLDMQNYPFSAKPNDYLLFVGRIDVEKGTHIAIDVAVRLKKKLIIAAKLDDDIPHIHNYFVRQIKPRLARHKDLVQWVGEVDEPQRNELMKNALCLLHPVTWPEPFGLVLIEAMACGTPVVALNLGSIPEVVEHGKTGFVAKNFGELLEGVRNIGTINRTYCREYALNRFSAKQMAIGYESVYQQVILKNKPVKEMIAWPEQQQKTSFGTWALKPSNS